MANYPYFSHNGTLLSAAEAVIPLSNIEFTYGFGVYETVRVVKGNARFLDDHCKRLMNSARIITLEHTFSLAMVILAAEDLIEKNKVESCNLKILLIGGKTKESADLYIECLAPLYPDRKLYTQGAKVITRQYERFLPQAKTLNMLGSYLAYKEAQSQGAYDALLVNDKGYITEGTRTNFFAIKGTDLFSAPEKDILLGVTRDHVIKVAEANGFKIIERSIKLTELQEYDGAFLTSTSTKIIPITTVDNFVWPEIPKHLKLLMQKFSEQY
ncbi:MAG: D-amino-acid transaminase [Candidatus Saccharibacteria bacterium]|nr:D-amino-acid transaminase [Candidatus Saccharibacteria bacterium]